MKVKTKPKIFEVLLVEDNPGDIDYTSQAIINSKPTCNLNIVNKGKEAIAFLLKKSKFKKAPKNIDMVLMSLRLPDMSGIDVLHNIRKNKSLKLLPVVILTSSQLTAEALKNYENDVFEFITKPLSVDLFEKLLNSLNKIKTVN
jgi:two-component system, chemotaxis family, response regulator Rcp1